MNFLMIVAICDAVYLDEWLEASTVAFLFALSLALESWSIGRARRAVAAPLNLTPLAPAVFLLGGLATGEFTAWFYRGSYCS